MAFVTFAACFWAFIAGVVLAGIGLADLVSRTGRISVLPWWGDLVAIAAGSLIAIAAHLLLDDD